MDFDVRIWFEVGDSTLSCESAACDAVRDFFEAGIHVQHFGWGGLFVVNFKVEDIIASIVVD